MMNLDEHLTKDDQIPLQQDLESLKKTTRLSFLLSTLIGLLLLLELPSFLSVSKDFIFYFINVYYNIIVQLFVFWSIYSKIEWVKDNFEWRSLLWIVLFTGLFGSMILFMIIDFFIKTNQDTTIGRSLFFIVIVLGIHSYILKAYEQWIKNHYHK